MSARIVFANGSKAMAHNNNDLFERWMLKRSQLPEPQRKPDSYIEVFLPELVIPADFDAMKELQADLGQRKTLLQNRIADLSRQSREEGWSKKRFLVEREPIANALTRVDYQLTNIKSEIKAVTPEDSEKWVLREKLFAAQERIIELQDEIIALHERLNVGIDR